MYIIQFDMKIEFGITEIDYDLDELAELYKKTDRHRRKDQDL